MFKHAIQILNDGDLSNKVIFQNIVLVPPLGIHINVVLGVLLTTVMKFKIGHKKNNNNFIDFSLTQTTKHINVAVPKEICSNVCNSQTTKKKTPW